MVQRVAPPAEAEDWNALARLDPLWAICSAPDKRGGGWTVGEFFATGEAEITAVLARPEARPARFESALDVGCGVGRTTRALSRRFATCYGVDISDEMIAIAGRLNRNVPNLVLRSERAPLERFDADSIDFVYSAFVLQHLPTREDVVRAIRELVRVARPDGAIVFQLPEPLPRHRRLQGRRRLFAALRRVGVREAWLYERLRLHPIRMTGLERKEVEGAIAAAGADLARIEVVDEADTLGGLRYYVRRRQS